MKYYDYFVNWVNTNFWAVMAVLCGLVILGWIILLLWFLLQYIFKENEKFKEITEQVFKIVIVINKYTLYVGLLFLALKLIIYLLNFVI